MNVIPGLPPPHRFVRKVHLAAVPGPSTPLIDAVLTGLQRAFTTLGHHWGPTPDARTDAFLTTARLHEPVSWRTSPLFVGRKHWNLQHKPATYAVVQATPAALAQLIAHFEAALAKPADPANFALPGLAPKAWQVLHDQGSRGGPMMCVARLLQSQSKALRVLLVVGDDRPEAGYLFDLAGAHPRIERAEPERFFGEVALRIATHLSTREVTMHQVRGDTIPRARWLASQAPAAMLHVSRELGAREFFTRMVRVADLVDVPMLTDALAQQYSEGCFATWDPVLRAQVVTVTGSSQPVAKMCIVEHDLAVIGEVLDGGHGVAVHPVEGLRNDPPSSEAVEFEAIDAQVPRLTVPAAFGVADAVPAVRSKLHGHRGVAGYDPRTVEYVPLAPPYFDYLVSCSTEAQAHGIADAFGRSRSLRDPADPRTVVFTVLPGHGMLMVEKWVPGRKPFEELLSAMDEKRIDICSRVPQGWMRYAPVAGRMELRLGAGDVAAEAASGGMPSATHAL
ncbi:MAG: hypothetical protein WAT39_20655 [Planctomycetota bacterium]